MRGLLGTMALLWLGGCAREGLTIPVAADGAVLGNVDAEIVGAPLPEMGAPDGLAARRRRVLEACVIASACSAVSATFVGLPVGYCLARIDGLDDSQPLYSDADRRLAQRLLDCAVNADCAALARCLGAPLPRLDSCEEDAMCTGSVFGYTPQSPLLDCAALGYACDDRFTDRPTACCRAPCDASAACKDGMMSSCIANMQYTVDCGATARACGGSTSAHCVGVGVGTGAACADQSASRCAGATTTFCSGGRTSDFDCRRTLFRTACSEGATSGLPCRADGNECTADFGGACAGDQLTVCVDGHVTPVDCRRLGFASCASLSGGQATCAR